MTVATSKPGVKEGMCIDVESDDPEIDADPQIDVDLQNDVDLQVDVDPWIDVDPQIDIVTPERARS